VGQSISAGSVSGSPVRLLIRFLVRFPSRLRQSLPLLQRGGLSRNFRRVTLLILSFLDSNPVGELQLKALIGADGSVKK
jgi:hypothetical protein